jgi:hypothetical protein
MKKRDKKQQAKIEKITAKRAAYEKTRKLRKKSVIAAKQAKLS